MDVDENMLSLVAFKFADKDKLLFKTPVSSSQIVFKREFPFFETQFVAAREKLRERVVESFKREFKEFFAGVESNYDKKPLRDEFKQEVIRHNTESLIVELTKKLGNLTKEDKDYIGLNHNKQCRWSR